jgi:hypothetical protein
MSTRSDERDDDRSDERQSSMPILRNWWSELSPAARVLIPTSAAVLLFVFVGALPPVLV